MKTLSWTAIFCVFLLGGFLTSWGNTQIAIYYGPPGELPPLTMGCESEEPLPSETLVYFFDDIDGDGPDLDDPLLQHCRILENGERLGLGIEHNRMQMDEGSSFDMPGYCALSTSYGAGNIPPVIHIFLRIFCEDGGILWESRVLNVYPLSYNEIILGEEDWICYDCLPFELCDPTHTIHFEYSDGIPQDECAFVCPDIRTWIFVTGLEWTHETTIVEYSVSGSEACSEHECPAMDSTFEAWSDWTSAYTPPLHCFHTLWATSPGCVDVELTGIEGIRLDTLYAEVLTDTTRLHLITERESNLDRFVIERFQGFFMDLHLVAEFQATNLEEGYHYIFNDTDVEDDTAYYYDISVPYLDNSFSAFFRLRVPRYISSESIVDDLPIVHDLILHQNYPNPFNPSTMIAFELPQTSDVLLTVYDINGREVATLLNQSMSAGLHETEFKAESLPSGVYFYNLTAGSFTDTKKMLLMK